MSKVEITKSENCIYLTQDISDLSLYQRAKAIKSFINNETLLLEEEASREIFKIFAKNGIRVSAEEEYGVDLYMLHSVGKDIKIVDLYENADLDKCVYIGKSKSKMTIVLEDDKYLQCGVEIKEKEI